MAPRFSSFRWLLPLTAMVLLAAEGNRVWAQTLNEGWNVLEARYNKERGRISSFQKGSEKASPDDKSHVEAIDLLAKTYTYSVFLRKLDAVPGGMDKDYQSYARDVEGITKAKDPQTMQSFGEIFRDKVRVHALEVLEFDQARPIHKIHNARVLAKVAELGQPELADTLIKLMKNPNQNDGVRYYALRGLATLLGKTQLGKTQQSACAEALIEFLEQRKGPGKNASPEEIDGFRLLRREAVRALAKIHVPAISDKVRPALVLARFAGNDAGIQPPPRLDERVEAALGLARLKSAQDKQYQSDYAAGQIAKALGAFAQKYNNELTALSSKKEMQTRPWRIDAVILKDALTALKADSGKNAYVSQMTDRGISLLDFIIKGIKVQSDELSWWNTPQSNPPSKELFQGSADSVVKPAQPAEAEPEK